MATGLVTWSKTAASNATADSAAGWPEGMAPSAVNDAARATQASLAMWRDDNNGSLTTGGTSTAYTATTNQTLAALTAGYQVGFALNVACGASPTINVDTLGAKPLRPVPGLEFSAGQLQAGVPYRATYYTSNSGEWIVEGGGVASGLPAGIVLEDAGSVAPAGFLLCYGQAISRTTYAALFARLSTNHGTGDGSTTFNVPDLRGRVVAGKDDMGGSAASRLTSTYFGTSAAVLGAAGGSESNTLSTATMPAHTHTGTSDDQNQSHVHAGTTSDVSQNHTHTFTATTGSQNATHTHGTGNIPTGTFSAGGTGTGVSRDGTTTITSSTETGNHQHEVSGTTNNPNVGHTHTITTGNASQGHTHTFTTASTGGGAAHANVQPTYILNKIIKY